MIAKRIIPYLEDFNGIAHLYEVNPPMDGEKYVVVSAINNPITGAETYIFPATQYGDITNWGELYGSFRGALDHERALKNAGYTVEN